MDSIKTSRNNSTQIIKNHPQSKIKAIFFDFDGVLSSVEKRIVAPLYGAVLKIKPNIESKLIIDVSLNSMDYFSVMEEQPSKFFILKYIFKTGKKLGMSNFQAIRYILLSTIIFLKNHRTIVPKKGVSQFLKDLLTQDYKLALITNAGKKTIEVAKTKIPELNDFALILTRDDVKSIKPNATGFFRALKILNLKADEVISIGDQGSDIIASKRAGVKSIAIYDKFMAFSKLLLVKYEPDFIINDLKQFVNLLKFFRDCVIEDIRSTIDLTEKTINDYVLEKKIICKTIS